MASAEEVKITQEEEGGMAVSTVDQVAMATLGQLQIPPASDVEGSVVSAVSGQSDQPLPQPQVTDSGAGVSGSIHATLEDTAPPTPEPLPQEGEEVVEVKHGRLEVPDRLGEGGGGESTQPRPLTVTADVSAYLEDTPASEQEVEPAMSPSPSPGENGNGDTNSSSVGGSAGKSQQEKSVLIRLSNRVRDLEDNMSLFSSYLDQLSTRCVCVCVCVCVVLTFSDLCVLCCHGYSMKKNKNKTEEINRKLTVLEEQLGELKAEVGGT